MTSFSTYFHINHLQYLNYSLGGREDSDFFELLGVIFVALQLYNERDILLPKFILVFGDQSVSRKILVM